jgi:hypothetical protein
MIVKSKIMIKNRKNIICICLLFLAINIYSNPLHVFQVENKYICVTSDKEVLFESESASKTIQFAVDLAHSKKGGEVTVNPGVFNLDAPVRLKDQVWLRGKRAATILKLAQTNKTCIEIVDAENVTVSELTLAAGNNKPAFSGISGINTKNCSIKDLQIRGFANYGMYFNRRNNNLSIDRCFFINNEQAHFYLENSGGLYEPPVQISNCNFFGGGYGILTKEDKTTGSGMKIQDNMFSYLKGMAVDSGMDSLYISGNKLYWIGLDGMRIKGKHFNMSGNINSWIRGHGLVLDGARNGLVEGNNLTDMGVRPIDGLRKCGIALYNSSEIEIKGNSIWNFGDQGYLEYAVYENHDCKSNTLVANAGWFHFYPDAYGLFGDGAINKGNTSNQGEYRGDFWDFSQKYSQSVEKYMRNLMLNEQKHSSPVLQNQTISEAENIVIECKDHFSQVLSIGNEGTPEKNGWTDSKLQLWNLKKSGEHYFIYNDATGKVLQCSEDGQENFELSIGVFTNEDHQLWELKNAGNGYIVIASKLNGKVVDSQGFFSFDWEKNNVKYTGQNMYVSDYANLDSQIWRITEPFPAYTYEKKNQ